MAVPDDRLKCIGERLRIGRRFSVSRLRGMPSDSQEYTGGYGDRHAIVRNLLDLVGFCRLRTLLRYMISYSA